MSISMKNHVAYISGGSSMMARGTATAFLEEGGRVVLGDIRQDLLDAAKADLVEKGFPAENIATALVDLTDLKTVPATFDQAESAFGTVDILVNIAGVIVGYYKLDEMREEDWDLTFNINVKGLMEMCREFVKRLKAKRLGGNIVNVSSNGAKVCFADMADYNASKAAVMNLTQSMALEWAPDGINVNAVCPGAVDTAMLRKCMEESMRLYGGTIEEMRKTWGPPQLGRLIQPYEVGRVIRFLASEDAAIIRGQSISVDAGNTRF